MSASIVTGMGLTHLLSGLSASSTGAKLIFLNSVRSASAASIASFLNTFCMRRTEIEHGIEVYGDEELTQKIGISKVAAKSAVLETAMSRVFLTIGCLLSPSLAFFLLEKAKLKPSNPRFKMPYDVTVFALCLCVTLPISISIFP